VPDITAARPTAGAPIESAWGDQVHDMLEGIQVGTVNIVVSAASTGTAVVTFPRAYATPPRVFVSVQPPSSATQAHAWITGAGVSTTGFTASTGRDDGQTFSGTAIVHWLAIGTPA